MQAQEKLLITRNFTFSHSIFTICTGDCKNMGLFGKRLKGDQYYFTEQGLKSYVPY